jgi:DNA ligase (NAD+)
MATHLKTSINFFKLSKIDNIKNLLNIDGIGETQISSIKKFFLKKANMNVLEELNKILIISSAIPINKSGLLKNKTFMLTGKLDGISRGEAKSLIEKNSGKIVSNVNKKLDYLIIGKKPTPKKISLAKALKTNVINQQEWMKMLNKTS